jgi:hypothetical protein
VEKGGLVRALAREEVHHGDEVHLSDELRLGLRGQVRRVIAPKGVKVVQPLQLRYEWAYLLLAVNPLSGSLKWKWIERMNQEHIKPVLEEWALDCVVWDGAGSHRGKSLKELPTKRVFLPAYSPELNPAERVFEELRRRVEGKVYKDLKAKRDEAERYLKELKADPQRVKRLCGWDWLQDALRQLPPSPVA